MTPIFLLWQVSGGSAPPPPELWVRAPRRRKNEKQRRAIYRHPEEVEREQRMLAEYLLELEKKDKHLARAPAGEPNKAERSIPVPRLTDAMARAASAEHLVAIARSATAAVLDRHKAAEEQRRRGLTAILLLALD